MSKAVKRTTGDGAPDDADNETTRFISSEDATETQVLGSQEALRGGYPGSRPQDSRPQDFDVEEVERTRVISEQPFPDESASAAAREAARQAETAELARREAEERRRQEAEQRARERASRERSLGTVPPPVEPDPTPVEVPRPVTDRAFASLGLLVFRIVVAGVLGVHGFQHLTQRADTLSMINQIGFPYANFPYANYLVWVLGIGECLAGLGILVGLWTRAAGLGAMAIGVLALVYVHWHGFNIFETSGIAGEPALLVAASGFLLFCVGSGGWGLDAGPRRRRALRKATR